MAENIANLVPNVLGSVLVICICSIPATGDEVIELIQTDSVQLDNATSSSVLNETDVRSKLECAARCLQRGCSVASMSNASGSCQLIVLNNELTAPNDSRVQRLLEAGPTGSILKATDLELRIAVRRAPFQQSFSNTNTGRLGSIQSVRLPATACYRIEASGARGGSTYEPYSPVYYGGNGATVAGNFSLTAGTVLSIVVGQKGSNAMYGHDGSGSGGGGGSFVYRSPDNFLLLAAGGGGGGHMNNRGVDGQAGTSGTNSLPSSASPKGWGGANGQPGFTKTTAASVSDYHGGSGAGWLGNANMTRRGKLDGDRGGGLDDKWLGGIPGEGNSGIGGFGGGGGGGFYPGASGAGGGFSGGGAGLAVYNAGGGGGSFCGGSDCTGVTGGNTGAGGAHGSVEIHLLPAVCP